AGQRRRRQHVPRAAGIGAAARGRQLDRGDREGASVGRGRADRLGAVRSMTDVWPDRPEAVRDLAYYEAVPYLLVIESVERGGEWLRRAEHPELEGCAAEAPSAVEAMEKLDRDTLRLLRQLSGPGGTLPAPPPALSPA